MADEIGPPPEGPPPIPTQQPAGPFAVTPAIPTRPVSGGPIASAWGQDVHDRIYTPRGVSVSGAQITNPANYNPLPLDTVLAGNASFANLAADQLVIPAGLDGLYLVTASVSATALGSTEIAWAEVMLGASLMGGAYFPPGMTGNVVTGSMAFVFPIVAGTAIYIRAIHTGSAVKYQVINLGVTRIGNALA